MLGLISSTVNFMFSQFYWKIIFFNNIFLGGNTWYDLATYLLKNQLQSEFFGTRGWYRSSDYPRGEKNKFEEFLVWFLKKWFLPKKCILVHIIIPKLKCFIFICFRQYWHQCVVHIASFVLVPLLLKKNNFKRQSFFET